MKELRFTVTGPRIGMWKVIDGATGNMVGPALETEEAANDLRDECNAAHERNCAEHKSIVARIKELIAA